MNLVQVSDQELMEVDGGRRGRRSAGNTQEARDQAKHTAGNVIGTMGIAATVLTKTTVIMPPVGFALGLSLGVASLLVHNTP